MAPAPQGPRGSDGCDLGRGRPPGVESSQTMTTLAQPLPLHVALLRRSVGALAQRSMRCAHCRRTPLIGEHVYLYESERLLCELCRPLQREVPARSEVVHSVEEGATVRIRRRRGG